MTSRSGAELCSDCVIELGSDDDCVEKLQTTEVALCQEISARDIHPMKLIMLLRLRFGIERYEILVRLLSRRLNKRQNDLTYNLENTWRL